MWRPGEIHTVFLVIESPQKPTPPHTAIKQSSHQSVKQSSNHSRYHPVIETSRKRTIKVVLASASPRRSDLLRQLVPDFEIVASNLDEEALTCDDPTATAKRLALAKAEAITSIRANELVIGADTVVAYQTTEGHTQLAKPRDEPDAVRMLNALSGRSHSVITGVALVWPEGMRVFSDETRVTFRTLHPREIDEYVASGEPMDKAGAYAIQGGAAKFVIETQGSITNVIGLPLEALAIAIREAGFRFLDE